MGIYISTRSLDYTNIRWICTIKMNKRCTMEIYISRRSFDYTNAHRICTYEDEGKMHNGYLHFPKKFRLYQRVVDLYLWRWRKDAQWKFTFPEKVWIIPTCCGFVPMKMNKRCTMEIYISRRSLDYTYGRWICIYEDE